MAYFGNALATFSWSNSNKSSLKTWIFIVAKEVNSLCLHSGPCKRLLHSFPLYFEGCARLREEVQSGKLSILPFRNKSSKRV